MNRAFAGKDEGPAGRKCRQALHNLRRKIHMANKWVYLFSEGNAGMRNLLGGKGANLAEMTNLGLPIPDRKSVV